MGRADVIQFSVGLLYHKASFCAGAGASPLNIISANSSLADARAATIKTTLIKQHRDFITQTLSAFEHYREIFCVQYTDRHA
jgi:hypothetical protein